jgi:hypothetical protein
MRPFGLANPNEEGKKKKKVRYVTCARHFHGFPKRPVFKLFELNPFP